MDPQELGTLRDMVLTVLEETPKSRNSDVFLTLSIWYKYYKHCLFKAPDGEWSVKLKNIQELPREDNVKRIRAQIQNEDKLFLPTNEEVAIKRGWLSAQWKRALGYPEVTTDGQGILI